MKFYEIVEQVLVLLQRKGRVSYRALKREFDLDDEYLEDLKAELIDAQRVASDEEGKVLVWTGASPVSSSTSQVSGSQPPTPSTQHLYVWHTKMWIWKAAKMAGAACPTLKWQDRKTVGRAVPAIKLARLQHNSRSWCTAHIDPRLDAAERRQLTVLFCDLVDSTKLSEQLDPEEYRAVVRAYHETCAGVIAQYAGHTAQHLGDGLLVYFGYPTAHEDDAQRAVRTGLEIIAGLQALNAQLPPAIRIQLPHPIQVRIGIHTGLVVIGEIGSSEKREILALGETPNIAARLQGLAEPNTVVISAATARLVQGLFECQDLGSQTLKGISTPLSVYRVVCESEVQSRFEVTVRTGLTPLVGRDEELGLLLKRWERVKEGEGQVVLLSGEPGIGKSRLVQELKEQVSREGYTRIEFRCSPYYQNSALYPVIEHLQRLLQFKREDSPEEKLNKLEQMLRAYRFPQADTVPLLAALFSLPHPDGRPPLTLTPQRQKQKTQEALMAWLLEETEKTAVYCAWEDLHWADPSTLEFLSLIIDQVPAARMLILLTCRPEFSSPWGTRSHLTQITLSRLTHKQVEEMVKKVTGSKALPFEVLQQVVTKTDGVPLFVEELTKTVMESGLLREVSGHYELTGPLPPLAIPVTLQDSLMARLDRLATVREVAQLGATLGKEFSYELLQAVSPLDEMTLQEGLTQLVEAEFLYQRGLPPQARYLFKHALIQDAAYQSLLKSTRQQYHQQIAQVLEQRFSETVETHPELVAHHYTEAGLIAQAIPYWQKAGQRAVQRSANLEALSHLTKGLELLKTLPDTRERVQHELTLQVALGSPLLATKGYAAPEVGNAYTRARELCQQIGETPQLFPVLMGLRFFYTVRGELQTARELGEQLLRMAQGIQDPALLLEAHYASGVPLMLLGEFVPACVHFEQSLAFYDPQQHRSRAFLYGQDSGVGCLSVAAWTLWFLGYPEHAFRKNHEAITLAQELSHTPSLAFALGFASWLHRIRQDRQAAQERTETLIALSREQGFSFWLAPGTLWRGWALVEQGHGEGVAQMCRGLAAWRATGAEAYGTQFLATLAEGYGKVGQAEEGLAVLAEALAIVDKNGERYYEAELYRLKGTLTLQSKTSLGQVSDKSQASQDISEVPNIQHLTPSTQAEAEAEACFQKAIEIARRQQAKSWELRATMSLARLWQQQGKQHAARNILSEIYDWFTEGFDTADLQEAKALLEELA
jgi:TOMM system kinase/cyclase fusion protein